jgi:hypothetical protein
MQIVILLTKEDIATVPCGSHYVIKAQNGIVINFTPEALDQFVKDINFLKKAQAQNWMG